MSGNGKAPPAYYDKEKNVMVQEDVHLMDVNQRALIEKEYHTYNVEDLEKNIVELDASIEVFEQHIEKEQTRKKELLALITEGKERDGKLAELGF